MALWGTIVNAVAILVGSFIGILFRRIPEKVKKTIMQALGLAVLVIGATMAFKMGDNSLQVILGLVIGSMIGEWFGIEDKLEQVGNWFQEKMKKIADGKVADAFAFASLIFCIGAMAIMGALQSGLQHVHSILYTKALLDGFSSVIFSSTMGIGIALAAIPVLIYQGIIALSADWLRWFLTDPIISVITATGGILIMGISLNILELKKMRVGNMLPAIPIAAIIKFLTNQYLHF